MPFVEAKLTVPITYEERVSLHEAIAELVNKTLNKPKEFLMVTIESNLPIWMNVKPLEKGAFISVRLMGDPGREAYTKFTAKISDLLHERFGIGNKSVYVTFHPTDYWGWNKQLF